MDLSSSTARCFNALRQFSSSLVENVFLGPIHTIIKYLFLYFNYFFLFYIKSIIIILKFVNIYKLLFKEIKK